MEKDVEQFLKDYYYNLESIQMRKNSLVNKQALLKKLENIDVHIDAEQNMGVSYGEKVQTSRKEASSIETAYIRQAEKLSKEIADVSNDITELKIRISKMEENIKDMEIVLQPLSDLHKKILKYRFGSKYSVDKTAMLVELPSSTTYSWQKSAMKDIENKLLQLTR